MLFNRGNAISGDPIIIGKKKLPNPPINTGITNINIIIIPCKVTIALYKWMLSNNGPVKSGLDSWTRIRYEKNDPIIADIPPKQIYIWPINLWSVVIIQLVINCPITLTLTYSFLNESLLLPKKLENITVYIT